LSEAFYTVPVNSISQQSTSVPDGNPHRAESFVIGAFANVKVLDSTTSKSPSVAQIIECSSKGIMLRVQRYLAVGSLVQVQAGGQFSVWKVFCCVPSRESFHVGLEPAGTSADR
jgi:hypothetical protein